MIRMDWNLVPCQVSRWDLRSARLTESETQEAIMLKVPSTYSFYFWMDRDVAAALLFDQ